MQANFLAPELDFTAIAPIDRDRSNVEKKYVVLTKMSFMNDLQSKLDIIRLIVIKPIRNYISFLFIDPHVFYGQS
jgi:hypothetical protein